ncbi:MAG: hypothetical protein DDT26_02319 [Dehalococcoidia bacterium]|nr:hypothetical protein [Chloroflexota bacterium]
MEEEKGLSDETEVEERDEKPACNVCGSELTSFTLKGGKGIRYRCPECKKIVSLKKKDESSGPEAEFMETGEALIRLVVHIPSSIITLFYYARANNLIEHEDIVSFMVEYTEYGFMRAHGLALTLAPIKTDGDSHKDIEELKGIVANLQGNMEKIAKRGK